MNRSSISIHAIEYAVAGSLVASLVVFLMGACVFGFQLARWAEWQGGLVGIVGTIAGVAGAAAGLRMAAKVERRAMR
jgi:hypothetical protein